MLVGGNPVRGSYEQHIEIYSPAYLFTGTQRPTIAGVTPGTISYGGTFQVQTPDAANIASVVLVRPGSQTHAFDMDQRLVGLTYSAGSGALSVTAPANGNIAPPGYYMLFILNAAGVPSVATFVRLSTSAPANQAPTATITSPITNVTVNPGDAVIFSGTGSDPDGSISSYSWTFPGGNPSSSSSANAGQIFYSTPGSYVASFTVTDNQGLASQAATRTVTVSDFSLSATPPSQSVLPGGGASFTATVMPLNGFTGTVTFSVSGLPSGATASFNPSAVSTSGSTTLSVSTSSSTPAGSYPLTITGTSGPRIRSANVTLVVTAPNQAPTATITSPTTNVTINPGGVVSFAGTGSDPDGSIASYAWTFPGGNPSSSTSATAGNVSYSTPGSYVATFTVTDNQGLASQPATRTITVSDLSDFSLSASPATATIAKGGKTSYTVTLTPLNGFTGTVTFAVTGLPKFASARFNPQSVVASGNSQLAVSTNKNVAAGTYDLVVSGTSGSRVRSTTVKLVVQ
jgi:PKD repeat protein